MLICLVLCSTDGITVPSEEIPVRLLSLKTGDRRGGIGSGRGQNSMLLFSFFSLNLACSFRTLLGLRVREMGRKPNFKTKKLILKLDLFHSP